MKNKPKTLNKRGLTLIEIILAMAILGIIAVAMFPVFTGGLVAIMKTGDITDAAFRTSGQIEVMLNERDQDTRLDDRLEFDLDGTTYSPQGHVEDISHTIKDSEVVITFFFPSY